MENNINNLIWREVQSYSEHSTVHPIWLGSLVLTDCMARQVQLDGDESGPATGSEQPMQDNTDSHQVHDCHSFYLLSPLNAELLSASNGSAADMPDGCPPLAVLLVCLMARH